MPRAVSPWTWNKKLRDHGPNDRDFLLAMLVLYTFMDANGFTFVGLRLWAKAARMAVNTLRKHEKTAIDLGWLYVKSVGGPHGERFKHERRSSVPDSIELSDKDQKLADAVTAVHGDIDESVSIHSDTDIDGTEADAVPPVGKSVSVHVDTDSRRPTAVHALAGKPASQPVLAQASVSNHGVDSDHLCQSAGDLCQPKPNLYQTEGPSVSPRVIRKGSLEGYSEVSIEVSSEEGAACSTTHVEPRKLLDMDFNPFKSPKAESRKTKNKDFDSVNDAVEKLAVMSSVGGSDLDLSDTDHIARMTGCTQSQVVIAIKQLKDRGRLPVVGRQRAVS